MDKLDPLFIVTTGRSGSQLLYRMLAHHRSFRWFTNIEEVYPNSIFIALLGRIASRPFFYRFLEPTIQPSEAYSHWAKADPGFVDPYRPLRAEDLTTIKKRKIREIVSERAGSKRLLGKYTGWSMIPYMNEAFPKSKFIHIIRDGRAVVNSFLHLEGWRGWEGLHNWRWGFKEEYVQEIEKYDHSFVAIAALQWKILTEEIKSSGECIGKKRFIEIKYENLVENPINTVKNTIEFAGEEWTTRMQKIISRYKTENRNYKWKRNLSHNEKKILNDILNKKLVEYDYDIQ